MRNKAGKLAIVVLAGVVLLSILLWVFLVNQMPADSHANWAGVDETVIEKYAADAGREAAEPFINTDRGDLLLFVFALTGTAGGFLAGYCWRMITSEKN